MNMKEISLKFVGDVAGTECTKELLYYGNENIIIRDTHIYDEETHEKQICISRGLLEAFIKIIEVV